MVGARVSDGRAALARVLTAGATLVMLARYRATCF